jgi:peptidoglycan/LPS O-acetylase OafA/YrhL
MLVVFNHAGTFLALPLGPSYLVPSEAIAQMGAIGVDLFFVISGFVMALSARRYVGLSGAGVFLAHRFIRIAPLFYLACLVMLAEAIRAGLPLETASVLNSITFIPIFDDGTYSWPLHYLGWTLGFEWVFYLLVAVLIASGRGGQHKPLLFLVMAVPLLGFLSQPELMAGRVLSNPILGNSRSASSPASYTRRAGSSSCAGLWFASLGLPASWEPLCSCSGPTNCWASERTR